MAWHYLCRFQPGFNDAGCGPGFAKWSAVPPGASSYRRHQGAWIQDADGDGTEDLHLPFYSVYTSNRMDGGVLTISMANNQQTWTRLNMAEMAWDGEGLLGGIAPSDPGLRSRAARRASIRVGFTGPSRHSAVDGRDKALMIGGNPVGYFPTTNTSSEAWLIFCQVARYVGVIGNPQGQLGARTLEWGWYLGFNQNVFANNSGNGALLKDGYMAHGCIHRYSDARVQSSHGVPSVAFNLFRSADFNARWRGAKSNSARCSTGASPTASRRPTARASSGTQANQADGSSSSSTRAAATDAPPLGCLHVGLFEPAAAWR